MSNKLYNGNNTDYLIEGAGKKGYMKSSGKSYPGDEKTSDPVKDYSDNDNILESGDRIEKSWFNGKNSSVGSGMRGPQGKL